MQLLVAEPDVEFDRSGPRLSVAGGVGGCGSSCYQVPITGSGRFEFGYRWGLISAGVATSVGGAPYESAGFVGSGPAGPTGATASGQEARRGSLLLLSTDVFAQLNPVRRGRLDPFFAAGFGYHRLADRYAEDGEGPADQRIVFNAPAVRLSVGLPIFVSRGISFGPRIDQILPFSGSMCAGGGNGGDCEAWSQRLDGINAEGRRVIRRGRERPWAVSFEIRLHL